MTLARCLSRLCSDLVPAYARRTRVARAAPCQTACVRPWRKIGERPLRDGYVPILARRYTLPDDEEREFEIKLEGPTAVVLALTPDREVVLVREFRPGVEDMLLELPGGLVDDGEEPAAAARRELLEETGYAGEIRYVGSLVDCAYSTRIRHVCTAVDARQVQAPAPHDGEFPEVATLRLDEFRAHLRSGRLTDVGPGYLALDSLDLL